MEELLQKANIDYFKLQKNINRIVAYELSNLSEPCYYPSLKKYYYEILHIIKVSESDVKKFIKRFYKGHPASKWKLHVDPISNLYIFLMHAYLSKNLISTYKTIMLLYIIRNYTNLMNKQIAFCNKNVFKYTLEHLAKTHLFIREKTIPNALFFLSNEMDKTFRNGIKDGNVNSVIKFITVCRTRVSQSIKSFAELYYKANKEGLSIREPLDTDEENSTNHQMVDQTSRVIYNTVKNITVYKIVNKKAVEEAKNLTKIKTELSYFLAKGITNIKYTDLIKTILELFIKDIKSTNEICGEEYYKRIKVLTGIKRTNQRIYFKQQVAILISQLIKELDYEEKYYKLTKQTQTLINIFMSYYITMLLRDSVC